MPSHEPHTTEAPVESVNKTMTRKEKTITWFKRLGWAAFLFFLIKGIAWIIIGVFFGKKAVEAIVG